MDGKRLENRHFLIATRGGPGHARTQIGSRGGSRGAEGRWRDGNTNGPRIRAWCSPRAGTRTARRRGVRGTSIPRPGWYNQDHHHSALGLLTPADVHHGVVEQRVTERQAVLDAAFEANPERFPRGRPIALTKLRERLSQTR